MITRPRALGALLLTLALVAALMVPALAATTASYDGPGRGENISGSAPGMGNTSLWAGEMEMTLEGGQDATGFCIDILTSISPMSGLDEQDWETSGISNLDKITYILQNYDVDGSSGLGGNASKRAASIQAAIWHFSDDFELTTTGVISNNYDDIIEDANANAGAPQPSPSLDIDPASATAYAGQQAGPFVVTSTGSNVPLNLDVPAAQAVDSDGDEVTQVNDGDEFWVTSPDAGDVKVSASITTTIEAGRVFGKPGVQRLILAASGQATSSASATATFDPLSTGEPVDPTIDRSQECGVADKLTIPTTAGVEYLLDDEPIADGTVLEGPLTGTITASALEGYELDDADWEFEFELAEAEPCPELVTPIAPEIDRSDECDVPDSFTVPTTEGIEYQLDGTDVSGDTITGPASGTLVAVAKDGYVLESAWTHEFDLEGADTCAQAGAPTVQVAEECDTADQLIVPTTEGIEYLYEGTDVSGQTIDGPGEVTITAIATEGYELIGDSEWTFTLEEADTCATAVSPSVQVAEECDVADTLTIPETTGVQYLLDGSPIAGGTELEGPLTGTLTATALDGHVLTNPEWTYDIDLDAADPCPVVTEPVAPTLETAEECGTPDTLTIPDAEGVQYLLNGDEVASGTVIHGPSEGTTEYTLAAVALDGYDLDDPEWSHTFALTAGEPCPDPVVAPSATIAAECTDDEGMTVAITLDNSDSEEEVTYLVTVAGNETEVTVAAGESTTVDAEVAAGTGEYDVNVEVAGDSLAYETFDTADCETEVAGVVIEADDEDETDDEEDETEVLGVQLDAEDDELAETGISALLLVLLGLFGIAAGGTLVRRRS